MLDRHSDAPSIGSRFPGFGEGAPLELPNNPAVLDGIRRRFADGSITALVDTAEAVRNCSNPIRLIGNSIRFDKATGEQVGQFSSDDQPLGVLYLPCGNRRADKCPSCSRIYARDTFEMIRAGVVGGKTIPVSVAANPLLFATFTPPSFGAVHSTRSGKRCHPRDKFSACEHGKPQRCMATHGDADDILGAPLCDECYDWQSALVWQWFASSELFRRTAQNFSRVLATRLGLRPSHLRRVASIQYAKVAEYQERGLVHFHVLIRLDGPDGPGSPAPALDPAEFASVVREAVARTSFTAPPIDGRDRARELVWGRQVDIRPILTAGRPDNPATALSAEQVAGYLAKYATKSVTGIRHPGARPHLKRLDTTSREIGRRARAFNRESPYRLMPKWSHMLGFPGHFSSKSRRYSITLGRLRRARHRFMVANAEAARRGEVLDLRALEDRLLADEEETTLVIGNWTYQGSGWTNPGDEALALAAAARSREHDQWRASQRTNR